jgi:DNA-binding response OmpR family regulator
MRAVATNSEEDAIDVTATSVKPVPCVLVIDDDARICKTMRYMLSRAGIDVLVAATAEDGLGLALSALPDAIICDLALPDLSGLDVLRMLKERRTTARIPVILTSGSHAIQCPGVFTFLQKPFDMAGLVTATRNALASSHDPLPEAA